MEAVGVGSPDSGNHSCRGPEATRSRTQSKQRLESGSVGKVEFRSGAVEGIVGDEALGGGCDGVLTRTWESWEVLESFL